MGVERARELRRRMSPAEAAMWNALRTMREWHFRRQVPLGRYYADFASHRAKLVIEIDGDTHGTSQMYDFDRERFMRGEGYEVMRFTNDDVLKNVEGVTRVLADWLEARPVDGHGR